MRRMERKALATKQAQKQEKPERCWTISWDFVQKVDGKNLVYNNNSVKIYGRCVAIDTWHALYGMREEGVTNLKCTPELDVWECFSDDPSIFRRQFEW